MKTTIKDIAKHCGVTSATVSYVLNNRSGVSVDTRERVLGAIRDMRYQPSAIARGLVRQRMNTVGVVFYLRDETGLLESPYFTPVLDGILNASLRKRQKTLLFMERDWDEGMRESTQYLDGHCDGLIFVSPIDASKYVAALHERGVPHVFIGDSGRVKSTNESVCSVDVDNVRAARELTLHLIRLGHKRIAFLAGDIPRTSVASRIAGYREALVDSGLPFDSRWILPGVYNRASGYERTHALMRASGDSAPTAIFGCSDLIALGALQALKEMNVQVPQDVSVVGFDDIEEAARADPPLTTMRQPLTEIGDRAVEILLQRINNEQMSEEAFFLPTKLIERQSTAAPEK